MNLWLVIDLSRRSNQPTSSYSFGHDSSIEDSLENESQPSVREENRFQVAF